MFLDRLRSLQGPPALILVVSILPLSGFCLVYVIIFPLMGFRSESWINKKEIFVTITRTDLWI